MNEGEICVSVCAATAGEFIENIERAAAEAADVIELRLDCLKSNREIEDFLAKLKRQSRIGEKSFLVTFRPKEQGGNRALSFKEREDFWNSVGDRFWGGDFEEDVIEYSRRGRWENKICSYHDFSGVPENLNQIYERLKATKADVIKIAVRADDIADAIPLWRLLARAKAENKKIIPVAMGDGGRWTRILGLAHDAFMTYAAPGAGRETAPGQISARDLIEVYRVKELNEKTEIYGIVGGNTSYSMSPYIHNAAFKFHNLNAVFIPLQVKDLDGFMRRMAKTETREIELNFRGFAVTIPHKQNIVGHLDFIDETAREIGAVNTVKIGADGKFSGYNTDASGFIEPLQNSFGDLQNAKIAVVGAGGASRAVCYALKKSGAEVTVFARNPAKAEQLKANFGVRIEELLPAKSYRNFDVLVNATPLGTKGETENETPASASQLEEVRLVYDLIYNPSETKLIKEAKKAFVPTLGGLSMLIAQASAQQKIWTSTDAPVKEMSAAALRRL
jgi:3-dehydroquinate dehydratase/shikimate dehydrogenase